MPFGNLVSGSSTFSPLTVGTYSLSTRVFGDPRNDLLIKPGTVNAKNKTVSTSIYRIREKDVVDGAGVTRKSAIMQLNLTIPSDTTFTVAEIDALLADLSTILTPDFFSRNLQGEV